MQDAGLEGVGMVDSYVAVPWFKSEFHWHLPVPVDTPLPEAVQPSGSELLEASRLTLTATPRVTVTVEAAAALLMLILAAAVGGLLAAGAGLTLTVTES